MRFTTLLAAITCALSASPVLADGYAGFHGFGSQDADGTDILKYGVDWDWRHPDKEHYLGVSLEVARFRPMGQEWREDHRAYLRFADTGSRWKWNGRVGTDGHTVLGSASINDEGPNRQEYFIEREIVETPQGLDQRLYSTFVGGAWDRQFGDRTTISTVLGVQDFTGDNLRLHYRGTFSYALAPEQGLSAQLRLRYFHDSEPEEFDYFSPGWYAQAIPTLQLRRFANGWQYVAAAGYGVQNEAGGDWRSARLVHLSATSPDRKGWVFKASADYTNTPVNGGAVYDYTQVFLSIGRRF